MYCTCLLLFSLHFWCCFLRDTRNILPCANFDLHINQVQWMSRIFQFRETNLISGDSKRLFRLQATFQNTPHGFWSQLVAASSSSWFDLKTDCSLFQPLIMNLYNILIDSTSFDCDILTYIISNDYKFLYLSAALTLHSLRNKKYLTVYIICHFTELILTPAASQSESESKWESDHISYLSSVALRCNFRICDRKNE